MKRLASAIDDGARDGAATSEHQLDVVHACIAADMQRASDPGARLSARIGHEIAKPAGLDLVIAIPEAAAIEPAFGIGHHHPGLVASRDGDHRTANRLSESGDDAAGDRSRVLLGDLEELSAGWWRSQE